MALCFSSLIIRDSNKSKNFFRLSLGGRLSKRPNSDKEYDNSDLAVAFACLDRYNLIILFLDLSHSGRVLNQVPCQFK